MAVFSGNGSAASPSFTFSSDTNLGIFRSGTDELAFTTAGTERARLDAAGALEIGGTLGSAPNITLNAGGSGKFVGNVQSGGNSIGGTEDGSMLRPNSLNVSQSDFNGVPSNILQGYETGDSLANILVQNDGGVYIQPQAFDSFGQPNEVTSLIVLRADGSAEYNGNVLIGGTLQGATPPSPNISLNEDGSATFVGGVAIGGTVAANTMDEYEEGTWNPNTLVTTNNLVGTYTKVGNTVNLFIGAATTAAITWSGTIFVTLPFTASVTAAGTLQGFIGAGTNITATDVYVYSTSLILTSAPPDRVANGNGNLFGLSVTYTTAQ